MLFKPQFSKQDVMEPLKRFLENNNIPSDIITDVSFTGKFVIYVHFKKGSIEQYGNDMRSAFDKLPHSKFSYALMRTGGMNEIIECWAPFINDIVEANRSHRAASHNTI